MANLKKIIYLSNEDYATLVSTGTVVIGGTTLTYDADNLYVTPNTVASQSESGLMSAADKVKLDGIAAGAKPGTITGVSVNGTSIATSGVANIPAASNLASGVITTSAQEFAGVKTFPGIDIKTINGSDTVSFRSTDQGGLQAILNDGGNFQFKFSGSTSADAPVFAGSFNGTDFTGENLSISGPSILTGKETKINALEQGYLRFRIPAGTSSLSFTGTIYGKGSTRRSSGSGVDSNRTTSITFTNNQVKVMYMPNLYHGSSTEVDDTFNLPSTEDIIIDFYFDEDSTHTLTSGYEAYLYKLSSTTITNNGQLKLEAHHVTANQQTFFDATRFVGGWAWNAGAYEIWEHYMKPALSANACSIVTNATLLDAVGLAIGYARQGVLGNGAVASGVNSSVNSACSQVANSAQNMARWAVDASKNHLQSVLGGSQNVAYIMRKYNDELTTTHYGYRAGTYTGQKLHLITTDSTSKPSDTELNHEYEYAWNGSAWQRQTNIIPATTTAGKVLKSTSSTGVAEWGDITGGGDVTGPNSSSNGSIAAFNDSTGKVIRESGLTYGGAYGQYTISYGTNTTVAGISCGDSNYFKLDYATANTGSMYMTGPTTKNIGTTSNKWSNLYLSGNLSDGTNSITVAKIANNDNVVHKTGEETISGTKTFKSTPIIQASDGSAGQKMMDITYDHVRSYGTTTGGNVMLKWPTDMGSTETYTLNLPKANGTIATTNDIPTALQSSSTSSTGAIPYIEFVSIDSDGVLNLTTKYMKI